MHTDTVARRHGRTMNGAIASGAIGRIVEVYDEDEGQRVEIFVE